MVEFISSGEVTQVEGKTTEITSAPDKKDDTIFSIAIHSKFSNVVAFNTLYVPAIEMISGRYNYYIPNETDSEFQENKEQLNYHHAPMFISIKWSPVSRFRLFSSATAISKGYHGVSQAKTDVDKIDDKEISNKSIFQNAILITKS